MKKVICILSAVICLFSAIAPVAYASGGSVVYSGDAGRFIFSPGSRYSPTDLFNRNFKDVMPGDSITETITVRNKASNKVKVNIYMRALGAGEGSAEGFLDQLHLTVSKAKDTIMFDAATNEQDGLADWVLLGTLYSGGTVDLNIKLDIPITLGNEFQKRIGYIDWEFMVEENQIEKTDPKLPYTGRNDILTLWLPVSAAFAGFITVLFVLKRKKEEKAVNE